MIQPLPLYSYTSFHLLCYLKGHGTCHPHEMSRHSTVNSHHSTTKTVVLGWYVKRGDVTQSWLSDLYLCFSDYMSGQFHNSKVSLADRTLHLVISHADWPRAVPEAAAPILRRALRRHFVYLLRERTILKLRTLIRTLVALSMIAAGEGPQGHKITQVLSVQRIRSV